MITLCECVAGAGSSSESISGTENRRAIPAVGPSNLYSLSGGRIDAQCFLAVEWSSRTSLPPPHWRTGGKDARTVCGMVLWKSELGDVNINGKERSAWNVQAHIR